MKPTHRSRIIISALIMTICAQLIFVWTGIRNAQSIGRDMEQTTQTKLLSAAEYNVSSFFNHTFSMLMYLQNSDIIEYANSFLALRDPGLAQAKRSEVNDKLNQIDIDENLIETLYVIGQYNSQLSIVKHAGNPDMSDEPVPTIYDMGETGLLHPFENNNHMPTYYAPGSLVGEINSGTKEQIAASIAFAKRLEDHVVIDGGVVDSGHRNSTIVILVLKKGFLSDLVSGKAIASGSFTLVDQNGVTMDRSGPDIQVETALSMKRSMNAFGFTLKLSTEPGASIRSVEHALYLKYGIFFGLIMLLSLAITFFYSYYILLPFRKMSAFMRKQLLKFPLQHIAKERTNRQWFPSISLRNHLIALFVLSVFIPAVSSGVGYYTLINQYTVKQQQPFTVQLSNQAGKNLRLQMALYDDLLNKLSLNQTFNHLFYSSGYNKFETPDVSFLQYPGIGDVSYFVLYNLTGARRYASQYTTETENLDTETKQQLEKEGGVAWSANKKDIYNQPTAALTKPFYSYDESMSSLHPIGYIQIVLNAAALQSMHIENDVSIVTMNRQGDIYFHNESSAQMLDNAKDLSERLSGMPNEAQYVKASGIHGIAVSSPLEGTSLHSLLVVSIDSIMSGNRQMFDNFLIVMAVTLVIATIMSFVLTRWLVRPLEQLKEGMERAAIGRELPPVSYASTDEIGDLILSFNGMMDHINQLMDTNLRFAEENSRNEMKQQELIALKTQAELSMLQQQIDPHFLYNTLQSIGMKAQRTGEDEVGFMIVALAELFRYSISHKGSTVELAEELAHTRNYIAIQDFRFKDKFEVEWDISEEARTCRVIKFILQPLVENAISHGLLSSVRKGKIRISALMEGQTLVLTIQDNGLGIERPKLEAIRREWEQGISYQQDGEERKKGGVGLNNVYFRLRLAYKDASRMTIESEPFEGTTITIEITQ